jgi:hypothetical protein
MSNKILDPGVEIKTYDILNCVCNKKKEIFYSIAKLF